jgi:hypothetical protein
MSRCSRLSPIPFLGFLLMAGSVARGGEEGDSPALRIRAKALQALREFEKQEYPGDPEPSAHERRHFEESKVRAFVAQVWAGDKDALKRLKEGAPIPGAPRFDPWSTERDWPESLSPLLSALRVADPGRAAEAAGMTLRRLASDPGRGSSSHDPREVVDCKSFAELVEIAKSPHARSDEREYAMKRWMVLDKERALEELSRILRNEELDLGLRLGAAGAIAGTAPPRKSLDPDQRVMNEPQGIRKEALDLLREGCLRNYGGAGRALIEAGEFGQDIYLALLGEKPVLFRFEIDGCPVPFFCERIDEFLAVKDSDVLSDVFSRVGRIDLPLPTLAKLVEYGILEKHDPAKIAWALTSFVRGFAPADLERRGALGIWYEAMQEERFSGVWEDVARSYLSVKWGSPEIVAEAARRYLRKGIHRQAACEVLGVLGKTEDVELLWKAVDRPFERKREPGGPWDEAAWADQCEASNWSARTSGWFAVVRLTTHLARAGK